MQLVIDILNSNTLSNIAWSVLILLLAYRIYGITLFPLHINNFNIFQSQMNLSQSVFENKIREINRDPTLTKDEKSKKIHELMMSESSKQKQGANSNGPNNNDSDMHIIESKLCPHYVKKCSKFKFACCQDNREVDNCHRCHMERTQSCQKPIISQITCDECDTEQVPSNECISCHIKFSTNYCSVCGLWTVKDITHCVDCGLCRLGAPGTLQHCHTCGICFNKSSFSDHTCTSAFINHKDKECPICLQSLFSTQNMTSQSINCGHLIHSKCLESALKKGNYRCPLCKYEHISQLNVHLILRS